MSAFSWLCFEDNPRTGIEATSNPLLQSLPSVIQARAVLMASGACWGDRCCKGLLSLMLPMDWEKGEKAKMDLGFPTNCFLELYNNLNQTSISWFSGLFFFYRSKTWWISGLQNYKLCLAIPEVELLVLVIWTSVTRWPLSTFAGYFSSTSAR